MLRTQCFLLCIVNAVSANDLIPPNNMVKRDLAAVEFVEQSGIQLDVPAVPASHMLSDNPLRITTMESTFGYEDQTTTLTDLFNLSDEELLHLLWRLRGMSGDDNLPRCSTQLRQTNGSHCMACHDDTAAYRISFPPTLHGIMYWQSCPRTTLHDELEFPESVTVPGYATRLCLSNGTWSTINYTDCLQRMDDLVNGDGAGGDFTQQPDKVLYLLYVYAVGFAISNIAMAIAMVIFVKYRHLHSVKNFIHWHLLFSITLKNTLWMALFVTIWVRPEFSQNVPCIVLMTFFKYFQVAQFCWMFMEGLYLFMVVVKALRTGSLGYKQCLVIGWGLPALFIIAWILVKVFDSDSTTNNCWNQSEVQAAANAMEITFIALILVVNMCFMVSLIYTLVIKLRTSSPNQSQRYHKAIKATLVLIPLFGGIYLLMIFLPSRYSTWHFINAVLNSLQGFVVSVVYCFITEEVKSAMLKSHRQWKDERTLPTSTEASLRRRRSSNAIIRHVDVESISSRRSSRRPSEDAQSPSKRCVLSETDRGRKSSPNSFPRQGESERLLEIDEIKSDEVLKVTINEYTPCLD